LTFDKTFHSVSPHHDDPLVYPTCIAAQ
jgi:hypothetical protein